MLTTPVHNIMTRDNPVNTTQNVSGVFALFTSLHNIMEGCCVFATIFICVSYVVGVIVLFLKVHPDQNIKSKTPQQGHG